MTSHSFKYATKVWLTSVLISPLVYFLISRTLDLRKLQIEAVGLEGFILFSIIAGLLFSLPSWTVFFFVVKFINKQPNSIIVKKTIIGLTGILLTFIPFYLVFFKDNFEPQLNFHLKLLTSYSLTIIIGILIYQLRPDISTADTITK